MAEASPTEVLLKNVRLSFEHIFTPTSSVDGGALKYRASALMDPETADGKKNIKACEKAIAAAEMEEFKKTGITYKDDRCAFKKGEDCISGTTGEPYDGYEGMMVVSAANARRVPVVDRDRSPLTAEDGRPYSGCIVNMLVRWYCVSGKDKGGNGCFSSLEAVQFVKDGEAFGAAPVDANSVFDDLSDEDDDDGIG
jgi:hypothetical protein